MENLVAHSRGCRRKESIDGVTKGVGICNACDQLKTARVRGANFKVHKYAQSIPEDLEGIYCKVAVTQHARCTKLTFPKCGCGKLVYYRQGGSIDD
jgi:hypothetical protein